MACKNRALTLALLASAVFSISSCSAPANGNSATGEATASARETASSKTNAEELRVFVNLPQEVEDVVFKEFSVEKKLTAVLLLSSADADQVSMSLAANAAPKKVSIQVESWFPAGLVAQADATGDGALLGDSYPATQLLLEPYTAGTIARVDGTDYFVLEALSR